MNWLSLIPNVFTAVGEIFQRKHEVKIKKLDLDYRIAEAEATAKVAYYARAQEADINWELAAIQNSGWKDEYLTLFTTAIVLATFVPYTQEYVSLGFQILTNDTPIWFQIMIAVVYSSAFGVRVFDNYRKLVAK